MAGRPTKTNGNQACDAASLAIDTMTSPANHSSWTGTSNRIVWVFSAPVTAATSSNRIAYVPGFEERRLTKLWFVIDLFLATVIFGRTTCDSGEPSKKPI